MALIIDEYDKYSIKGKIIGINNNNSTLTISVTSPYISVIEFDCNSEQYDVLHPPVSSKYNWIDWVQSDGHPVVTEASTYYNTVEKCFYKKESGSESEWEHIDFDSLYNNNPDLFVKDSGIREKYQFFIYRYMSILHKEQLCYFSAYAFRRSNRDWHSIHNNEVERHPEGYYWIYDPDSFRVEKWDAESINGLAKEIRPSRDCLMQLLESYKADDRDANKEKWKSRWKTIKSTPEHLQNWLTKYDKIWLFFTSSLVGALVTIIATLIINRNR